MASSSQLLLSLLTRNSNILSRKSTTLRTLTTACCGTPSQCTSSSSSSTSSPFSTSSSPPSPSSSIDPTPASEITFWLNGVKHVVPGHAAVDRTVLEYVRSQGLTGSKLVCGEGGCGCCTLEATKFDPSLSQLVARPINACLAYLPSVHGASLTTVEALSAPQHGQAPLLHVVQQAMAQHFASQCGFCTPGFVMAIYARVQAHLRLHPARPLAASDLYHALDGNLCRCTGYRPIMDALHEIAAAVQAHGLPAPAHPVPPDLAQPQPGGTRPGFPVELKSPTRGTWYGPSSLLDLLRYWRAHPSARLVSGASEVCIENRLGGRQDAIKIGVQDLPELKMLKWDVPIPDLSSSSSSNSSSSSKGVLIGPNLPLSDLLESLEHRIATRPDLRFSALQALADNLAWFSGNSIRNVATLGGNVATASPISDLNPVLVAAGALFQATSLPDSSDHPVARWIPAASFFGPAYRQTALRPGELLTAVWVPDTPPNSYVFAFKQSRRREDDIAIVNAGISFQLDPKHPGKVVSARFAFGGMGPAVVQAPATAAGIAGKDLLLRETMEAMLDALRRETKLSPDPPGGMRRYRESLALGFAKIAWMRVVSQIRPEVLSPGENVPKMGEPDVLPSGRQSYSTAHVRPGSATGTSIPHGSAVRQVSGAAVYTDDIPRMANELQAALVLSKVASGRVVSVDVSAASEVPGFRGFFSRQAVPGDNKIGDIVHDEDLFVDGSVTTHSQLIGIVVCDDERDARRAASLVKVQYDDGEGAAQPPLLTIAEAVQAGSFIPDQFVADHHISKGDVAQLSALLSNAPHRVQGEIGSGPQEHFYFEPNVTLAVPTDSEMLIYASSQNLNKTQMTLASVLRMPAHRIKCSVRRIGGGFGGKETDSIKFSAAAAVAAAALQRPVRLVLPRDVDMQTTGKRHAFLSRYDVGFDDSGRILAADLHLYSNGGNWTDLSFPVLDRALFHADNCYDLGTVRARGQVCRTNTVSNTAYRGFGGPQGMVLAETYITHVAEALGKTPEEVREVNMYKTPTSRTHFNQELGVDLPRLWQHAKESFRYKAQREEVDAFNREHKHLKQGLSLVPTKFGLAFTATFLNQGSAVVNIYTDGSVMVSHGGVEMGQGLHTKCQAIAADALGISPQQVYISETSTVATPNASPSAASMSSDIYGMAVQIACKELAQRLKPYKQSESKEWLATAAKKAYFDRVSLSAQGFYKVPVEGFNMNSGTGTPFSYFTSGVALSRVQMNCLTGDFTTLRSDVLMDVGQSLNPAIDVGQIEGAFMQGLGWATMEELVWADRENKWASPKGASEPTGRIVPVGPGAYKIPSMDDIPKEFSIHLYPDSPNSRAVYSSRGVGEPPFFLGASVYFALRDAIKAANQSTEYFRVDLPLTSANIRMAVQDEITQRVI